MNEDKEIDEEAINFAKLIVMGDTGDGERIDPNDPIMQACGEKILKPLGIDTIAKKRRLMAVLATCYDAGANRAYKKLMAEAAKRRDSLN